MAFVSTRSANKRNKQNGTLYPALFHLNKVGITYSCGNGCQDRGSRVIDRITLAFVRFVYNPLNHGWKYLNREFCSCKGDIHSHCLIDNSFGSY